MVKNPCTLLSIIRSIHPSIIRIIQFMSIKVIHITVIHPIIMMFHLIQLTIFILTPHIMDMVIYLLPFITVINLIHTLDNQGVSSRIPIHPFLFIRSTYIFKKATS